MEVWIVVVATWFCLSSFNTVESATKVCPTSSIYTNTIHYNLTAPLRFNTMTFDVDATTTAKLYSAFLSNFRKEVESNDAISGVAVLCKGSTIPRNLDYLLVNVKAQGVTMTMAIKVENLYFVAYKIEKNNQISSYFFNDFQNLTTVLFAGTNQTVLPFSSSYTNLANRADVDLGILALSDAVVTLPNYGKSGVDIRRAIVTIIGMVSEAGRFTLIERAINENLYQRIRPTATIISYQNNWAKISRGMINSVNGVLSEPIQLDQPNGTPYWVTKVSQVERNMGLLLFAQKTVKQELLIEKYWLSAM